MYQFRQLARIWYDNGVPTIILITRFVKLTFEEVYTSVRIDALVKCLNWFVYENKSLIDIYKFQVSHDMLQTKFKEECKLIYELFNG